MALSLFALTTPMSTDEVKTSIYDVLSRLGVPITSWKETAAMRAVVAASSAVLAAFTVLMAEIAKSGFLELAAGDWLTLTARYVYGVERIEATYATGEVTLDNTGGGVLYFDPGDVIFLFTLKGKTYTNADAFALAPFQLGVKVAIRALETGAASTASPGQINALETGLIGVTVTNEAAVVGLDAELDPALRLRCYEKLSSLSPNGPRGAYEFFAKTAKRPTGEIVGVTRVRVSDASDVGAVTVTVASGSGPITGDVNDPLTDLGAVNQAIQVNAVPDGVTVTVQSATALPIAVTYEVWFYASDAFTDAELPELIAERLTSFVASQPVGGHIVPPATGKVFQSAVTSAIASVNPGIFHIALAVPATDVAVGLTEVPVLGTVTCTAVHRMALAA